ncbi:GCN5 family N-acetyltransferase [Capsulimonas corticalis]|uniref:GCN5 family N-acetyltransferase n=1 Tax=Capsulimonas corticalis TaxID=2219043 RepID=A0A402D3C6_9BACT|nr:GNAT family N-acetyltransferase [Capsulimonas corticalis]BDI28583.1 GCN5 family N-acetyltransferase [Capsulimonas corticalis]
MNADIQIAAQNDIEALLPMIAELYAHERIPFDEAVLRPAVAALLADRAFGFICLARVDGTPAGYLIVTFGYDIEFGGRQATVTDVYVQPAFRRRGLAGAALRFAEEKCREHGVRALELQVSDGNTPASDAYEKAGFTMSGRFVMNKRLV